MRNRNRYVSYVYHGRHHAGGRVGIIMQPDKAAGVKRNSFCISLGFQCSLFRLSHISAPGSQRDASVSLLQLL